MKCHGFYIPIRTRMYLFIIVLASGTAIFIYSLQQTHLLNDVDRKSRLAKIDLLIREQASNLTCKQPKLDIWNPDIMKFVKNVPKINCKKSGVDWVKCRSSQCVIQEAAKQQFGPIKCAFTDIERVDDFELTDGETTYSTEYYKLEKSDVVRASCQSTDHKWTSTLTGLRLDNSIWDRTNWDETSTKSLKLNVLIFGYDSLSKNAFIRKLPNTYKYLTKSLKAVILDGYNIVGDGTPQALIPLLTGKTELELPDTRKRFRHTAYVNSYPMLWNDYKHFGYVTGFFEDVPSIGTFTYRLNGFKQPPTDHYMRPYYLANMGEQKKWPNLCTGDRPRHKVMLDSIVDFFSFYRTKPKFLFAFHGELSHDDYNLIGAADDDTKNFLEELHTSGALNDTLLVVMADHGHRFADVRNTVQGKQEERLPFFSFTFPDWFERAHPVIMRTFRRNAEKLVTPFDVHQTLKDVLHFQGKKDESGRAISLFTEIPSDRSCADAYIEPHWCACLDWTNVSLTNPLTIQLANHLVTYINNLTMFYRHLCEPLKLHEIFWTTKLSPNQNLLKFSQNADIDGFVADLSAKTVQTKSDLYQIRVILKPGESMFEAAVQYFAKDERIEVKESDISRTNMYKQHAGCVESDLPDLRKYCYCKS